MNHSEWMAKLGDQIALRPLNEIAMVGAHNAGTAVIRSGGPVDESLGSGCFRCAELLAPETARGWSMTQSQDVDRQLDAGVRFLDLQLLVGDDGKIYVGAPYEQGELKTVLGIIRSFVEHHEREIVIVSISRLRNASSQVYEATAQLVVDCLGKHLAPPDEAGARVTPSALWARGQRVLVFYPDYGAHEGDDCPVCRRRLPTIEDAEYSLGDDLRQRLWASELLDSPDPGTTSIPELQARLEQSLDERRDDRFLALRGFIAPSARMLAAGQLAITGRWFKEAEDHAALCLPGFLRMAIPRFWRDCFPGVLEVCKNQPTSLESLADSVTPRVARWVETHWRARPINVVLVDWFQRSNLVDIVIERNAG